MLRETFLDVWMDGGPEARKAFERDLDELLEDVRKRERARCARLILDTPVDPDANIWRLSFGRKIQELT